MSKLDMSKANPTNHPLTVYDAMCEETKGTQLAVFYNDDRDRNMIGRFMQEIESGNVDQISLTGNGHPWPKSSHYLRYYYNCLEPADRYRVTIDCYEGDGYDFPRDLIIGLKKIKPENYLEGLAVSDRNKPITIYRASQTPPEEMQNVKNEISWTTDMDTALFFHAKHVDFGLDSHIYEATILPRDIIAYTNNRNEYEVIQHGGAVVSGEVDVRAVDLDSVLEKHAEAVATHNKAILKELAETGE